jgi:hypothetical protein
MFMNKQNKRKNAPKTPNRYLSSKEAKQLRKWEELKEKYSDENKQT